MLTEHARNLEIAVLATLPAVPRPTENAILERAASLRTVFFVSDAEFGSVLKTLHEQLVITMELGTYITAEHRPWLNDRRASLTPFYWERFRNFLITRLRWPPLVVNSLDRVADDILDLAGDPERDGDWARKGLIVGDVQSGKTATYTALCCKAADAGFRLIILLTGTIENLRRQTQERLDEGFVGRDSLEMLQTKGKIAGKDLKIGVGLLNGRRFATVFTSRSNDFSIRIARQLGFSVADHREPILLVVKKNTRILENLGAWLEIFNADTDGKIKTPLLLIDDEADSASINTNPLADEATRTNREIRKLLRLFQRSSYVGVTATPFANVFIQPDTDDDVGGDLFPRDFIYSLEAPDNYMGPKAVFEDDGDVFLRHFDDADPSLPLSHKADLVVTRLPQSLLDAVHSFLLSTTIRDLRGEGQTHRSMLVNVSRFTRVQDQVASLLDAELREMKRELRLYAELSMHEALSASEHLTALHGLWFADYDTTETSWESIQKALHSSVEPIVVVAVNQRTGAASLDYKTHRDAGLRVIAVGGNSLSRGLTLEGLSTSYFHRNSQMYDTLLQMGRWFGYRLTYGDLCRLWLTEDAAGWYTHITNATLELRAELKKMRRLGLTPNDFGLKVRAHPDSLIVTARNKMRSARDFVHYVSLSGMGLETVRLRSGAEVNTNNYAVATKFIEAVKLAGSTASSARNWHFWRNVPKTLVATFLSDFYSDPLNFNFQLDAIAEFLGETDEQLLDKWDVALVSITSGRHGAEMFAGLPINPVDRRLVIVSESGSILISGSKARVGAGGDEREGIDEAALELIRKEYGAGYVPGSAYRDVRRNPLLLIYLIRGYTGAKDARIPFRPGDVPLVALGLSFPRFNDHDVNRRAKYKINVVEWRNRFQSDLEDDDDVAIDDHDPD
jgi:hypothetical protein